MVLTIVLLVWLQTTFEGRHLTGDSMSPTLNIGDRVIFDSSYYRQGKPFARGDVILFFPPTVRVSPEYVGTSFLALMDRVFSPPSLKYPKSSVKRVIGLPGDTVIVAKEGVLVNGALVREPYVENPAQYELSELNDIGGQLLSAEGSMYPYAGRTQPIVVPRDHLFVLGDNRNHSEDSHIWGFLPQMKVIGKAMFRYYPMFQMVKTPAAPASSR